MIIEKKYDPILITGAERSGSTLIARILNMCGVFSGDCNNMLENKKILSLHKNKLKRDPFMLSTSEIVIPCNWKDLIDSVMIKEGVGNQPWFVKMSFISQYWPVWHFSYPDAKWLIIRRRTGDIVQSCVKTGYMTLFKDMNNLQYLGFNEEKDGWLWRIHQYEEKFREMIERGLSCKVVWPDRMVDGNYEQIKETVDWLGLRWNDKIPEVISPLLEKSRRAEQWQEQQ